MKKLLTLFLMFGVFFFLFTSSSQAAPYEVPFGDSVIHWQYWDNSNAHSDNDNDVVYDPDLINETPTGPNSFATISESGNLESVNIVYQKSSTHLNAGSLFLDVGADSSWDYVLQPGLYSTNKIYQLSTPVPLNHPTAYVLSDYFGGGAIEDYRENHPIGIWPSAGTDTGETFSLVDFDTGSGYGDVIFSDFSLDLLNQDFIIGFGPTCANDVIYETVNNPVPIPTSILLFGSGLIGLTGIRRKRR